MSIVVEKVNADLYRKVELMKEFITSEYYLGYLSPKLDIALLGMDTSESCSVWALLPAHRLPDCRFKIDLDKETITDTDGKVVLGLVLKNYTSMAGCLLEAIRILTTKVAKIENEYLDKDRVYNLRKPGVALGYIRSLCCAKDRYVYCCANAGGYTATMYYPDDDQMLSLNFTLAATGARGITIKAATATGINTWSHTVAETATVNDAGDIDGFIRSCRRTKITLPVF